VIQYTFSKTDEELKAILSLQKANLKVNLTEQVIKEQGFVTCNHAYEILKLMNHPHPHIIAKDENDVVGYALVMQRTLSDKVPEITSMFQIINQLSWKGITLKESNYVVMGQVCVAKNYRGKGVFSGLYQCMFTSLKPHFEYIITDIATENTRSIRAHEKVGFQAVHTFADDVQEWLLVIKELN